MSFTGTTLLEIQQAITDRLKTYTYFEDIPIINDVLGDPVTMVDTAVGQAGLCVVVETPVANSSNGNIPNPYLDDIEVVITVWENVVLNRATTGTQKKFLDVAQIILAVLLQFSPTLCKPLTPRNPTLSLTNDPILTGAQVKLTTGATYKWSP